MVVITLLIKPKQILIILFNYKTALSAHSNFFFFFKEGIKADGIKTKIEIEKNQFGWFGHFKRVKDETIAKLLYSVKLRT